MLQGKSGSAKDSVHALSSVKINVTAFPPNPSSSSSPRIQAGHRTECNSAGVDKQVGAVHASRKDLRHLVAPRSAQECCALHVTVFCFVADLPEASMVAYVCTKRRALEAVSAVLFSSHHTETAALRAKLATCQAEKQQSGKLYAELGFSLQELEAICKMMR